MSRPLYRLVCVTLLGFASGLPLALTGQALQAWLTMDRIDLATIGFLSLVGLPYTFKFLWAPIMDRLHVPPWGRHRGWIVLTQGLLALALWALALLTPATQLAAMGWLALTVALLSASQDVASDAYKTELLATPERGLGASLNVMGYRVAMVVSGGLTLIWTDPVQGGWSWGEVYRLMALLMAAAAVFSALALPRLPDAPAETQARVPLAQDLRGLAAVLAAAAVGYLLTQHAFTPAAQALLQAVHGGPVSKLAARWADLLALLAGLAVALPLAVWAARRARFATLLSGVGDFLAQPQAVAVLVFVVLYKLGDAFAGALLTPFLLTGMGYPPAEVGVVNKLIGLWLSIFGALAGGAVLWRIGLWRALLAFGVLQLVSNLGFAWLAQRGAHVGAQWLIPAFDWGFVHLVQPTPVDAALLAVIAFENLSGGMGTAAFLALLMGLTRQRYTATQFALLSAVASVGRVWVGPMAGVLAQTVGWPVFFALSTVAALPALLLLVWLRPLIASLNGAAAK